MKRWWFIWLVVFVVSCAPTQEVEEETEREERPMWTPIVERAAAFHFVIGWLADDEVAYVVKEGDTYEIRQANVETGEKTTVWTTEALLVDASIVPTRTHILVQTADDGRAGGELALVSLQGKVERTAQYVGHEVHIAHAATDPYVFAYTTFSDDWSYDTFIYDGHARYTKWVDSPFPFPQWVDGERLIGTVQTEDGLYGEPVVTFDWEAETTQREREEAIAVHAYDESLLFVTYEDDTFHYSFLSKDGTWEWEAPAVSHYSVWVPFPVHWVNPSTIVTFEATAPTALDESDGQLSLIRYEKGKRSVLQERVSFQYELLCNPTGSACFTGDQHESFVTEDETVTWLQLQ